MGRPCRSAGRSPAAGIVGQAVGWGGIDIRFHISRTDFALGLIVHFRDDDSVSVGDQAGRAEMVAKDVRDNIVLAHSYPPAPGKIVFGDRSTRPFVMSADEIGSHTVQGLGDPVAA